MEVDTCKNSIPNINYIYTIINFSTLTKLSEDFLEIIFYLLFKACQYSREVIKRTYG